MIELRVLGPLDLRRDDGTQVLSLLSQPKRTALLCYLALAASRGARRRDELLALFWPELDTERARASLRQSIYFLRRSLEDAVLLSHGDEEVAVDPAVLWCDAHVFEEHLQAGSLEQALELYRGELLPAFQLEGSPQLVEWVDGERERLRRRAADAAWQLAAERGSRGETQGAADWARRALAFTPLDEAALRRCMEMLDVAGDRAAALQLFEDFTRRLARELELEPGGPAAALAQRLRTATPSAVAVSVAVAPAVALAPQPVTMQPPPASPDTRSVAVLPFVSMSRDPDDAYLSDGITDEIITTLAKVQGLRVASRTSSFAYKGRNMDVRTIGRELNVATVLEGSVQRAGEKLRITAQLIECAEGFHIWSAHWDSSMQDVFAIEDEIAAYVGRVLRVLLQQPAEYGYPRLPRTSIAAYEHYLRGRAFFQQTRLRSLRFAREMFERAVADDPEYALAHAAWADTVALERMYYPAGDADMPAADRASLRALELDPALAEAHSARGNVLFQLERFDEAERAYRTALTFDPQLFETHYFYARMCFQRGRLEDAAALFLQACRLRDDFQASFFAAQSLAALGRTDEATAQYREALATAARHMELNPDDPRAATMRAVALCRLGETAEGLAWGRRATELDPADASVKYNVACLHAVAGETEEALRQIEEAVKVGFGNRAWLEQDPDLDPLRADPRFTALLDGMATVQPPPAA